MEDLAGAGGPVLLATLGTRMRAMEAAGDAFGHSDTTAFALFEDYLPTETGPTVPIL